MSLARSAIQGGLWMAGIRYISFAVNFIGNIWLARLLVPEDFGVFALAMSISEILFMLGGFGLAMACIQLQDEPQVFDTGLVFSWVLAIGLSFLGLICAWLSRGFYTSDVAHFLAVLCVMKSLQMPASIYLAYLEKNFSFRRSALISGIGRSSAIGLAIILAILGFGKWSLLLREVIAIGLVFFGALIFSSYRFGFSFNKNTALKIWHFSFGMFFMRMSEVLFNRAPNFLVGSLAGPTTLGLFERSLYVSNLPNTMLSQFYGKVGFAVFSKVKNRPDKIGYGLEWNLFFASRIMCLAGVLVFLFPTLILTTLLGDKWAEAGPLFQGFSPFIVVLPLFAALKHGLMAVGAVTAVTISRMAGLLIVAAGIIVAWLSGGQWVIVPWAMSLGAITGMLFLAVSCYKQKMTIHWLSVLCLPMAAAGLILLSVILLSFHRYTSWFFVFLMIVLWAAIVVIFDKNKLIYFYNYFRR